MLGFRTVRKRILLLAGLTLLVAASPAASARPGYAWHDTPTGTTAHFRGLSAVSASTAWVSGYTPTDGVVMRTTDSGATWQDVSPPGSAGLNGPPYKRRVVCSVKRGTCTLSGSAESA